MKLALIVVALYMVQATAGHPPCRDCKDKPMDISFVMDSSSSVTDDGFKHSMEFIVHLLEHFTIGQDRVRASLISFGGQSTHPDYSGYQKGAVYEQHAIYFKDNVDIKTLSETLLRVPYKSESYTNTSAGIEFALDRQMSHSRDSANRVMVVITDGKSQDPELTAAEGKRARSQGITVFSVGVGPDVNSQELKAIAGNLGQVLLATSYEELTDQLGNTLTDLICDDDEGDFKEECRQKPLDLMFVIDSSSSIEAEGGRDAFPHGLQFISSILEFMPIDSGLSRVAAVQYAKGVRAQEAIRFGDYTKKSSLQEAILNIKYTYQGDNKFGTQTETGKGIDFAVNNFMSKARPEAYKAIVVLTDGESNYRSGDSKQQTIAAADRARAAGAKVFSVGVGLLHSDELRQIADSESQVFNAEAYSQLDDIREDITRILCWKALQ